MKLLESSLVTRGVSSNTYSMHRLVQAAMLAGMLEQERVALFKSVLNVVDYCFPQYDHSDRLITSWSDCGQTLPHVARLLQLYTKSAMHVHSTYLQFGQLLERASWYDQRSPGIYRADSARYLEERGMHSQAAELLSTTLDIVEQGIESVQSTLASTNLSPPTLCSSLESELQLDLRKLLSDATNSLGLLNLNLGRFEDALQHLQQAESMRSKLGIVDDELIYMKRNVGIALLSLNRIEEAHKAFEGSMSLREQQILSLKDQESFHDKLASNYGSLSQSLLAMKRYDEAWAAASRSTELCKRVHNPESAILAE